MQVASIALFRTIGVRFGLYDEVQSAAVNASDKSTGNVADLMCVSSAGEVVIAVEVKDRSLTVRHVQDKLVGAREHGIGELLFLVQGGIADEYREPIFGAIEREFNVGQNVYVAEFDPFLEHCLLLFGEEGRRPFLRTVGDTLDEFNSDLIHRTTWRDLLSQI